MSPAAAYSLDHLNGRQVAVAQIGVRIDLVIQHDILGIRHIDVVNDPGRVAVEIELIGFPGDLHGRNGQIVLPGIGVYVNEGALGLLRRSAPAADTWRSPP